MPDIREVLVTAGSDAWPAILIAAVTGLFAVGLARGGVPRGARAVLALGLASAFCVGLSRIEAWPSLPLAAGESAWLWTAWIAVGACARLAPEPAGLGGRIGNRPWSGPWCAIDGSSIDRSSIDRCAIDRCAIVGQAGIADPRARHIAMAAHGSGSGGTGGPASAHVVGS